VVVVERVPGWQTSLPMTQPPRPHAIWHGHCCRIGESDTPAIGVGARRRKPGSRREARPLRGPHLGRSWRSPAPRSWRDRRVSRSRMYRADTPVRVHSVRDGYSARSLERPSRAAMRDPDRGGYAPRTGKRKASGNAKHGGGVHGPPQIKPSGRVGQRPSFRLPLARERAAAGAAVRAAPRIGPVAAASRRRMT
jgi:hypothetical protein